MAQHYFHDLFGAFIPEQIRFFSKEILRGATAISLILGVLLFLGDVGVIYGSQANKDEYRVRHDFELLPGGNISPLVNVIYEGRAVALDEMHGVTVCYEVDPIPHTTILIPQEGGADSQFASVTCQWSHAEGSCSYVVNPFGPGTPVTGTIESYGLRQTTEPSWGGFARAVGFSSVSVEAQGGCQNLGNGTISWGAKIRTEVIPPPLEIWDRVWDPIKFWVVDTVTNDTVSSGTLLSIEWRLLNGRTMGMMTWDNDTVRITLSDAELIFDLSSPYTVPQGYLRLMIENDTVAIANALGIFAGVLPPVGTPLPISIPLPNQTEFQYSIPDCGRNDLEVTLHLEGGGEGTLTEEGPGTAIPTLTEWGLIIFGVLLIGFMTWVFLRRRKVIGARV